MLAGGRGTRLGGVDKAAVQLGGAPLVDRVYAALTGTVVIAVGPDSLARPGVRVVREDPPFGGPVAALAAGLAALPAAQSAPQTEVWLLACDLPRAGAAVELLAAVELGPDIDGAVLVDADDRAQWLAGRYRTAALRAAVGALDSPVGAPMKAVTAALRLRAVPDPDAAALDLDTWAAIDDYRRKHYG